MPHLDDLIATIKNSQKTLFILCGFPYAGKSFVARELQKHTDIAFMSIDAIFYDHGFDWNINKLPSAEEWQKIFYESYEITKEVLLKEKNVLYDSTNQTVASRNVLREVAESVGAKTKVLFIQASTETVWKRWEKNREQQKRAQVSRELIQMTIDTFEPPTFEEHLITIVND